MAAEIYLPTLVILSTNVGTNLVQDRTPHTGTRARLHVQVYSACKLKLGPSVLSGYVYFKYPYPIDESHAATVHRWQWYLAQIPKVLLCQCNSDVQYSVLVRI